MGAKHIERLAGDGAAGARVKKAARTILVAVDQMSRLVSDLLDLAKLEAGQTLRMDRAPVDVADSVQRAVDLMEPLASARKLALTTEIHGPAASWCDRARVEQVLSNLVGNAIKFTREGGEICVRVASSMGDVVVSVDDTGVGIPDAQVPHVFEPYWQADARTKKGVGLGLSIVKAIVDAHGGQIRVRSAEGRGSTFEFTLPAAAATPHA